MYDDATETLHHFKENGFSTGVFSSRPARPLKGLSEGESIALNGVCLTLDCFRNGELEFRLLPELGHALMLDAGWRAAAESIAEWLEAQVL